MSTTDSTSGPARLRHAGERWLREHQDKMSDSSSTFSDLAGLNSKGALGHVNNELHVAVCSRIIVHETPANAQPAIIGHVKVHATRLRVMQLQDFA